MLETKVARPGKLRILGRLLVRLKPTYTAATENSKNHDKYSMSSDNHKIVIISYPSV